MILKNLQSRYKLPLKTIRKIALRLLRELKISHADFDATFVGDAKMRALNRRYRNKDKTTDVLSFPLHDAKTAKKDGLFLGDIVISVPTALKQGKRYDCEPLKEFTFLIIHGLLHLLGYDHEKSKREEKRMQRLEKRLMKTTWKDFDR